ncbi:MAG: GNAT family N-acetyltransferase [Chloroflexi bacterium]|nr:MAG: GNAT family N-acetyltransferase [Chloroflexota bacterium]
MLAEVELENILPSGFAARPAHLNDIAETTDLLNACSIAQIGKPEFDSTELSGFWTNPEYDIETSSRIIENEQGKIVAYGDVDDTSSVPVQPMIWGRVHPNYEGLGMGSYLLQWGENTLHRVFSRVPDDLRVTARCFTLSTHQQTGQLFSDHNFQLVRHFWEMKIELDQEPAKPTWPQGIRLTTFNELQNLRAIIAATDDGFKDHWGHVERPLNEHLKTWQHEIANDKKHDPTLWFLAMEGDEITAVSLCSPYTIDDPKAGWVNRLAVRRPWRRRGLGLAILQHSIYELYRRGQTKVGLGVDANSITGATRLYEKAGMHVTSQYDSYEKELRPGRVISTQ